MESIFEPHFCTFYLIRFKREEGKRGLCTFEMEDKQVGQCVEKEPKVAKSN